MDTQNGQSTPIEETEEYQRLQDFARRIIGVPKEELDARLAESAKEKQLRNAKISLPNPSPKPV